MSDFNIQLDDKAVNELKEAVGGGAGGKMYWHQVEAYGGGLEEEMLGVTWILLSTSEPLTVETLTELSKDGFNYWSDSEMMYQYQKMLPQKSYYGNLGLGIIAGSDDEITWNLCTEHSSTPITRIEDTVIEA